MVLEWKTSVITQALVDLLAAAHTTAGGGADDLFKVYYGDQGRIPDVPSAAVAPGPRSRNFNQTGLQYEIAGDLYVMVYHGLIDDLQTITKEADQLVETLEATINGARKLPTSGGDARVIHSRVSSIDPGFANRGKSLFIVHRMTVDYISRHQVGL